MSAYVIVEFTVKDPDVYREKYGPCARSKAGRSASMRSCTAMLAHFRGTHAVSGP